MNNNYPAIVKAIHNEFNTAGEMLLQEANNILANKSNLADKAKRLTSVGFTSANEVQDWNKIKVSKELADYVEYYQQYYPNNKFITEQQVEAINSKYRLVCAPIAFYGGFVPDVKLKQIECFSVRNNDKPVKMMKVNKWEFPISQAHAIKEIRKVYPDDIMPQSLLFGNGAIHDFNGKNGFAHISSFDFIDKDTLFICAPKKDIKLTGLKKFGALFMSVTHVEVPDPVVLQPVKGGYLIVAAWGDEASDEIVVNQKMN